MVVKIMKKKSTRTILLIIPILFLAVSTTLLCIFRFQSYVYYERVQFESAGAKMHANLYHPVKKLDFQEKHPLVIYAHGSQWQKDIDIRVALELTKRGFFVATIDYQGHGESGGSLSNIDPETGAPAMAKDCSKLLDAIELLDIYKNQIDPSQIGLVGHSLGGLVVIMNGMLDNRFSATVSWAGVVDSPSIGFYNPTNIISPSRPKNLLIIHHVNDGTVSYEKHALIAQKLTGCTVVTLTEPIPISAHYLIADEVMIETIKWYEKIFFGATTKNGPITFSWLGTLILMILTYIAFSTSVISIMVFSSKRVLGKNKSETIEASEEKLNKKTQVLKLGLSIVIFFGIWLTCSSLFGWSSLLIIPILMILIYVIYELISRKFNGKANILDKNLREIAKSQLKKRDLIYAIFSSALFLGAYFIIALSYPFSLFYPPDLIAFLLTIMMLPLYISMEIFYRKIIFPSLNFLKSRKVQTYIVMAISFPIQFYLFFLTYMYYWVGPVFCAMFLAYLFASLMNGVIYYKTENFSAVLLNTFLVVGIFAGAASSAMLNIIGL